MKRSYFFGLWLVVLAFFTGCTGGPTAPLAPVVYHQFDSRTKVENIIPLEIKNGAIILTNTGEKIFDEKGDITDAHYKNGALFYLLKMQDENIFILKKNKEVFKEFKANSVLQYYGQDSIIYAVRLAGNTSNFYDNIYQLKNNDLTLINKNVPLFGTTRPKSNFYIKSIYENSKIVDRKIYDIQTSRQIAVEVKNPKVIFGTPLKNYELVGTVPNKIFYVYAGSNGKTLFEVFDTETNQAYTLLDSDSKIQFYRYREHVVLKIFDDKSLKNESKMHVHTNSIESKYDGQAASLVYLNTLEKIDSIPMYFRPVLFHTGFPNLGGKYTKETYITLDTLLLNSRLEKKSTLF
ncbi:MAG: hypothetical protein IBX45_07925 [Campylobacterales bacterium]|nr:hypothetical protein [Campylobacterales bacterium]